MRPAYYFQRIGSVMRDNQYDRTVSGYRSGKLGHKLYKVMLDDDRVFDRKDERKNKEYNVVIMIDESGSMEGLTIKVAAYSATMLATALGKNHINTSVMGFNKYIRVHKAFEEIFEKDDYLAMTNEIMAAVYLGGICNHDYLAVLQISETIRGLNPSNTIAMMFVDGRPECGCDCQASNPDSLLRDAAFSLSKRCRFITFGIMTDEPKLYYPNVVVIHDLNEFMIRSLYALQAVIRRG